MILKIDGSSEHGSHTWSKSCISKAFGDNESVVKSDFFRKDPFYFILVQYVLSDLLI